MKRLDKIRRTRLKLSIYFGLIASLLCGYAIYSQMDGVATVLAGVIGAIVAKYSHDETSKPSIRKDVTK